MDKMPKQTQLAIDWALLQVGVAIDGEIYPNGLVDKVREYFTSHNIECEPMSYDDLVPYLPKQNYHNRAR